MCITNNTSMDALLSGQFPVTVFSWSYLEAIEIPSISLKHTLAPYIRQMPSFPKSSLPLIVHNKQHLKGIHSTALRNLSIQ